MTQLRAPVGFWTSFMQQLRLLGWSGRWGVLVLGLLSLLVVAVSTRVDARLGLPAVLVAALLGLPAGLFWALGVWHGELPHRRAYHWSLPVSRPGHDLARIAAGGLWLLAAYGVLAAAGAVVAAMSGGWARFASIGPTWATFFTGPLALYLLTSSLALWSDSAGLRRALAAVIVMGFLAGILEIEPWRRVMVFLFGGDHGLGPALLGGLLRQGDADTGVFIAAALWFAIGLAATVLASAFRPRPRRAGPRSRPGRA